MNLDQITFAEFKELTNLFNNLVNWKNENKKEDLGKCIVILQRGWCVIGNLEKNGSNYSLFNGSVIRKWGTTKGLGEIAKNGPTTNTTLDPIPETIFHELTTIAIIKCEKWAWE